MSSNDIQWETIPASQFPDGIDQLTHEIVDEAAWAAVASMWQFTRFHIV